MLIEKDKVVSFHFKITEDDELLESSREGEPMLYMHGRHSLVSGLEKALLGKKAGESFSVTLEPNDAYGIPLDSSKQRISIKHITTKGKLRPGMVVDINTTNGLRQATVIKVGRYNVDIDTNHPMAGKTLTFEIEVIDVRDAENEELAHGHAHGAGGHHHH
ncbi:MAG: FKBP-type peptidyl-prolyl cis-trans isomerase SlyD [Gammaproteobacteria bacterium]|jgi:FKBP-type peptidyl-prolyl cis-trans isomerase SlyD